jgi:DnaJ-class molecular chaperone
MSKNREDVENTEDFEECVACNGSGIIECPECGQEAECPECGGTGQIES